MLWRTADAWIAHADGFYSYRIDPGSGGSYSPQRITRNGFATSSALLQSCASLDAAKAACELDYQTQPHPPA
jgi:hypothetical protein